MGQKNKRVEMMRDKKPSNQSPLAQCFEFIIPFEKVFHRLLIDSSSRPLDLLEQKKSGLASHKKTLSLLSPF